ncbi:restriction endonuclease subunit S [Bifidobacterium sp. MSK.13.1]|uniref:restriction endonuclease subunit S n=1 Tax=Bifidobacterium sp. MSK.13.1 TaxID=2849165 RepID=UPI001C3920A5|nr:restriction endonuclease subunit S [Bifidobacterium sp. MSK.13.1]MBV4145555.1 restriction endonuclease subunit S [Bifidobacterium sp. MSK.13.1]
MVEQHGKTLVPQIRFAGFTDPWEQRKLGELCSFSKGYGYSKNNLRDQGTPIILYGRLYTNYETQIHSVDTFVDPLENSVYTEGGEVIVPASGETAEDISIASVVEKPGIILGGDLNIITPSAVVNPVFLALELSYGKPHFDLAKRAQGKSVVHIHNEDIANVFFDRPCIAEQRRIGGFFDRLDSLITLHQRKYDKLCVLKKSMLDKMFPKGGSLYPEIRFAGFADPWEQRKLGEVANVCSGRDYKHLAEGPIPVYGTGGYMTSVSKALSYDEDAIGIGRKGTIDKPYRLRAPFWTVDTLFYAIPEASLDINFLLCSFLNVDWKSKDESTGLPSLSKRAINETEVLVPDIGEQRRIGAFFDRLDSLITLHQRKLELLRNIKKSMLDKMFV